jgi:hypothetical protein
VVTSGPVGAEPPSGASFSACTRHGEKTGTPFGERLVSRRNNFDVLRLTTVLTMTLTGIAAD